MAGQSLKVEGLNTTSGKARQDLGLGCAGVTIQKNEPVWQRFVMQHRVYEPTKRHIATLDSFGPPSDLGQDGPKDTRALAPAPAINQGTPTAVLVPQRAFDVRGHVAHDHPRTNLAGIERANLLVDRTDFCALGIVERR